MHLGDAGALLQVRLMIRFFIAGIPKAMSVGKSARVPMGPGRFKHFQRREHTDWCTLVGHIGRQHAPAAPLDGPISFTARFALPRPATLPKKVLWPLKRPDIDNLIHKLTDQFNGVFWHDDSQIVELVARKSFVTDARIGLEIVVDELAIASARAGNPQAELSSA